MNWMNLVWLLCFIAGLALLWFAIKGVEWLSEYVKERGRAINEEADNIAEQTEKEERKFLKKQRSREIIQNVDFNDDEMSGQITHALNNLTPNELGDALMQRVFGDNTQDSESIMATKSAFVKEPEVTVVAKGSGIMPVFAKKPKEGLSKEEKKIYDKVKKGS